MALFDFLRIALFPLDKWPHVFGQVIVSSRAAQFLLACQLYKVKGLRQSRYLENYECPCKQFSITTNN